MQFFSRGLGLERRKIGSFLGDFNELTISNLNLERRSEKKKKKTTLTIFTICMSEATSIFINNY